MAKSGSGQAAKAGAVANDKRTGRFSRGDGLTPQQQHFVRVYVRNGGHAKSAAIDAGYSPGRVRTAIYELMGSARVRAKIREESERYTQTKLASKALGTMERLLDDESTPHNVQFQAAKFCLEAAGVNKSGKGQDADNNGEKPLDEWSINELQAFIDGGQQALADRRDQESRTIDVTPDSAPDSAQSEPQGGLTD